MRRVGADVLVEEVPVPQAAVAADVQLSRADAANRHADEGEIVAAIDRRLASLEERLHPLGLQPFVGGHQPFEVALLEGPGHCGQTPGHHERDALRACDPQEVAPPDVAPAAATR